MRLALPARASRALGAPERRRAASCRKRLRRDDGFGLVELLIAMVVLNVGLLAILAAFVSGQASLKRASRLSTAATLADTQMELYRALTYGAIALDTNAVNSTDTSYRNDSAIGGSIASLITKTCTGLPNECNPSRTLVGPDRANYRVDTYIVSRTPPSGRPVRLVTVVVRNGDNLSQTFVRQSSSFDESTGS